MSTPCFFAVVMIGSSGRPTTVSPFSLNSIGIIASWPSLIRSVRAFLPCYLVRKYFMTLRAGFGAA